MMSSVIPARLQFQCGHAALVTLPRVKGESSAQRNERIAREKNAALARQCDFCGPTVALTAATRQEDMNGSHMTAADVVAAESLVAAEAILAEEPIVVLAEAVLAEEPIVVLAEESILVEEPVVVVEEEAVVVLVEEEEEPVLIVEPVVVVVEEPSHQNGVVPHRAAPRKRQPKVAPVSRGQRFLVEYRVERVLQAADIRDALRKATALGASQVLAITREDK
jgi:hypothetical protein